MYKIHVLPIAVPLKISLSRFIKSGVLLIDCMSYTARSDVIRVQLQEVNKTLLRKTTFIYDILECRQLHLILEWYSKNKKNF